MLKCTVRSKPKRFLLVKILSGLCTMAGCGVEFTSEAIVADEALTAVVSNTGISSFGTGDCCVSSDRIEQRTGCNVSAIEECVCNRIPRCCSGSWGPSCVLTAADSCGGCPNLSDEEAGLASLLIDSDGDGMLDLDEIIAGTRPFWRFDGPDIDGDGIPNGEDDDVDGDGELNAYDDDVDGDGIENTRDDDIDGDGLLNRIMDDDDDGDGVSNLIDNDDDADGFPDPEDDDDDGDDGDDDDGGGDNDKCGDQRCGSNERCVLNLGDVGDKPMHMCATECGNTTCSRGSQVCALDLGDGSSDPEYKCLDVPECDASRDEDGDGVCGVADPDPDGNGDVDNDDDGLPDLAEFLAASDPDNFDSDLDRLNDYFESIVLLTNPNDPDTDDDGLSDGDEVELGVDPKDPDSDNDGISDGQEVLIGLDPKDADQDRDGVLDGDDPFVDLDLEFDSFDDLLNHNQPDIGLAPQDIQGPPTGTVELDSTEDDD